MKKRILPLLFLIAICLSILHPISVNALTPLDPDAQASLTLHYQKGGKAFADLQIGIYRVAEAFPDGTFQLIEPFSAYPIHIHDITMQDQWQHVAETLYAYIAADQVKPDQEAKTDESGTVCFSDLKTGLYFVREVVAENTEGIYVFDQFMIYVPTPQPDGTYEYAVEANPKCSNYVLKSQYTVTKLWQDTGSQEARPKEVTIDIYKDGVLQETQRLNAGNNWTYTWSVAGVDHGKWTVVERSVPDVYKVLIQQNGTHFSIINTHQTTSDISPTGDSFALLPWLLTLCISGIALLALGIYSWRRR